MHKMDDVRPTKPVPELERIKGEYEALVEETAPGSARRVGWKDPGEQRLRFNVLMRQKEYEPLGDVLDVGCGTGDFLYQPGTGSLDTYTGLDFIEEHVDYARRRYTGIGREVKFIHTEAIGYLENETRKYDTVVASGVLAHYSHSRARDLLARMFYVVKPGGYMGFNWNALTCAITPHEMLIILADIGVERYTLRHDYLPYDFTCYVNKQAF